jgi:phage baseplate assembly protein W
VADRERKVYDFKSVGESTQQEFAASAAILASPKPIGIKTPIELGVGTQGSDLFRMHTSLLAQVADNLRNLIMTNHGERLGLYDYGANLLPLTFELGTEAVDTAAIKRIKKAAGKYMPYVNLRTFVPIIDKLDNQHIAKIGVRVVYTVPKVSSEEKAIEVMLYVGG